MKSPLPRLLSACVIAVALSLPGLSIAGPLATRGQVSTSDGRTAVTRTVQYQQGLAYPYRWHSVVDGQTHSEGKDGQGTSSSHNEAHAVVRLRVVEVQEDGSRLMEARVEEPHLLYVDEKGELVEARDEELLKQLQLPVYFQQSPDGSIGQLLAHKEDSPSSLNIKRSIVSSFQVSLESTEKSERDVSGFYRARYNVESSDEQVVIHRDRNQDDFERFADPTLERRNFALNDRSTVVFEPKNGIVTSSEVHSDLLSSTDGRYGEEGYAVWNTVKTSGSLQSIGVEEDGGEKPDLSAYADAELVGQITTDETMPAEGRKEAFAAAQDSFQQLQAHPEDPAVFDRFANSLRHSRAAVLDVGSRLERGQVRPKARGSVINALAAVGTPEAQRFIIQQLAQGGSTADKALIALAFVSKPSQEAADAVEQVFADSSSPLHRQAALVLGALAEKLHRAQPFRAAMMAMRLESSLRATQDEDRMALYLNALGNAGPAGSTDSVLPYLNHASPRIRIAALDGLRKQPAASVAGEIMAVASMDREPLVREAARDTLRELSVTQSDMAPLTLYQWTWNRWLGGTNLGANFKALVSANTDVPSNIILKAEGEAIGWAFGYSYSLVSAKAYSDVVTQNNVIKRHFNGNVKVLGITLYNNDWYVNCGQIATGNLYSTTRQFFALSYTWYLAGVLPVTLSLSASGTISVPYEYKYNACNAPVYVDASAKITPTAWISATGGVTVSIWVARGGAGVSANLLKTGVPAYAQGKIQNGTPGACVNVSLTEQPLSGSVYLWYQLRGFWGWRSVHSWTIWNFSSATSNYTLYNQCW
ncbi:MAG TPA: hypothetical protein VK447_02665 [Myxococcaceae bacterium]|nr:hypothetical protein [Myxococcaceae bacterium]